MVRSGSARAETGLITGWLSPKSGEEIIGGESKVATDQEDAKDEAKIDGDGMELDNSESREDPPVEETGLHHVPWHRPRGG